MHRTQVIVGEKAVSGNVRIELDGVLEVGKYIDFHGDYPNTLSDYTCRLKDESTVSRTITLPNGEGTIALDSDVTAVDNRVTTEINRALGRESELQTSINNLSSTVSSKLNTSDLTWSNVRGAIMFSNEFNFSDDSMGGYCWINYRGKSGNSTSVTDLYIGNGTGNGGYGNIRAGGFFKESDIRLKSNIKPLEHTLDQITNIPTVEFDIRGTHSFGTIAQDIENDFPDLVSTDKDGMKSVLYDMFGIIAIEGIKLLKKEIEDLKKQVEELKNGMCNL